MFLNEGKVRSWKPWLTLEGGAPGGGGGGNTPPADPPPGDPPPGDPPPGDPPPGAWHENTAWLDALPEGLKDSSKALEGLKGKPLGEVLAGYVKQTAEAAPPATPAEYQVNVPNRPDGTPADPKDLNVFFTAAHAAKLSGPQLQGMLDWHAAQAKAQYDADVKAAADATKALKEKWGDKYPERETLTARAIETFPEGLQKIIKDAKLGSDPFFIELIYTIGEAQREGQLHLGDPGGSPKDLAGRIYKTA